MTKHHFRVDDQFQARLSTLHHARNRQATSALADSLYNAYDELPIPIIGVRASGVVCYLNGEARAAFPADRTTPSDAGQQSLQVDALVELPPELSFCSILPQLSANPRTQTHGVDCSEPRQSAHRKRLQETPARIQLLNQKPTDFLPSNLDRMFNE